MESLSKRPSFCLSVHPTEQTSPDLRETIGESHALKRALDLASVVAPTSSNVLLLGETGTGKELIARAIHQLSSRQGQTLVKLNCAAIPAGLLESELFGHEKGSFTGAVARKPGRFEIADKGTLFLDEVGDIPLELQPKLLRVLQEQEFEKLGSNLTQKVDVRLIAATHRDLEYLIARNEFRRDLYYRLNVFPITLPSLRERQEDIPALVSHFVAIFSRRMGKRVDCIPASTLTAFMTYAWPGNIRELQNIVERAVILSKDGVLPNPLSQSQSTRSLAAPLLRGSLHDSMRAVIEQTLQETGWVIGGPSGAAARLGLKRTTLLAKMKRLGIMRTNLGSDAPTLSVGGTAARRRERGRQEDSTEHWDGLDETPQRCGPPADDSGRCEAGCLRQSNRAEGRSSSVGEDAP